MKRLLFYFCIFFALSTLGFSEEFAQAKSTRLSDQKIDVNNIDAQIQSLENLKNHYLAKATRLRARGDRLQFQSDEQGLISAEKCWNSADHYDRLADQIQEEIDNLEKERERVLNKSEY